MKTPTMRPGDVEEILVESPLAEKDKNSSDSKTQRFSTLKEKLPTKDIKESE